MSSVRHTRTILIETLCVCLAWDCDTGLEACSEETIGLCCMFLTSRPPEDANDDCIAETAGLDSSEQGSMCMTSMPKRWDFPMHLSIIQGELRL